MAGVVKLNLQGEDSTSTLRESTGISKLDEMISGGFPRPSITAIIGAPGTGTTTFCKQFVASSLQRGRRVIALCADEPPEHFVRHLKRMGSFDAESYIRNNKLIVLDAYSRLLEHLGIRDYSDLHLVDEVPLYRVFMQITKDIAGEIGEPLAGSNVILDSLAAWSPLIGVRDVYRTISAGRELIRERGYVVLVTVHEGTLEGNFIQAVRLQADNVIRMNARWIRSSLKREMIIEKVGFTEIRQPILEFNITDIGIEIV
jgi:KaiC/GvpD/RAD55 family RecA-like ATPase